MDTLEVRMAHLEGAYQQIDKRLGSVESGLVHLRSEVGQLRTEMHSEMDHLRLEMGQLRSETSHLRTELTSRMDGQFRWLLGTILGAWVTLLLAIVVRA